MSRRGGGSAVETGCGYKVMHSDDADGTSGTITIVPTTNFNKCDVTVGIGNADITFDTVNPPEQLTKVISGDASGDFAPAVDIFSSGRSRISYDSVDNKSATITDSDGNEQTLEYAMVNGYSKTPASQTQHNVALHNVSRAKIKMFR